jgi:hypothetical protein
MLIHTKLRVLALISLLGAVAITVRVPVQQISSDQLKHDELGFRAATPAVVLAPDEIDYVVSSPPWTRAYVWELGNQPDGSDLRLRWPFYLAEQTAWLGVWMLVYWCVAKAGGVPWMPSNIWIVPLLLYICVALSRLLYVPCLEVTWRAYGAHPDRVRATTIALWNIRAEQIRYGLVVFEELVLLAIIASVYGVIFAACPNLWQRVWTRGNSGT